MSKLIRDEEELQRFRKHWTGDRILDLVSENGGRIRVSWPIGVGKSTSMDSTVDAAVRMGRYDLVIVLCPTRRLIEERLWIREPPGDIRVINLRPRPRRRCGDERDTRWKICERRSLGALGRVEICGQCPRRRGCFWPGQYGKRLKGARVVYATQAHLERSPSFILQLKQWTSAQRILVLLDESNFILKTLRQRINHRDLARFVDVLADLNPMRGGKIHSQWLFLTELLLRAPTCDLRCPEWRMPPMYPDWTLAVQMTGRDRFQNEFQFLGYQLQQFGHSPSESRERDGDDLVFSAPPYLGCDFVIYSGTAHPEFSKFRLGHDVFSPFDDYRFEHPGTLWYNIASRIGTKTYWPRNADQVLDFFANLTASKLRQGRRVLLVAKKQFVPLCAREMKRRLGELGFPEAVVITRGWSEECLSASTSVPLINYGMIGTNLFEDFDCAYCLTGYYVTEEAVSNVLHDVVASDCYIPINITTNGIPRRRIAGVVHPAHKHYDVHRLAPLALAQQEMDVVLQAVGRVRPYTRRREVITFQCADHPQLEYSHEFHNFGEAREYFKIPTRRLQIHRVMAQRVIDAKRAGQTQSEAAREIGVSRRTVKRYWNNDRVT